MCLEAFFPVKKQSNNRDVPNGANEYRPYRVQNDTFSQRDVINDYLNPDSSSDLSDEEYLGQANEERGNIMEGCFHVLDDANNIPYSSPQYSDVTEQRDDVFYDATPGTPSDNLEEVANSVDQLPTEAVEVMPFEPLPTLPTLKNSDVVGVETAVVSPFPDKQLTVSKHEVVQMEVASTESSEPLSFHPQQQSSDHMMKDDCLNIPPALEVSSNQSKDENGSMGEVTTDAEPHTEPQTANEQVTIPVYNKDEDNRRFKNTSPPPAVLQSVSTNNTEELSQNTELTVVETVAPTETKSPDMNVPFAPVKPDPCVEVKSIDPQIKCETSSATVKSEIEKIIQPEVSQESLLESSNCSDVSETSKECLITKTSNEVPVSQQSNKMKKSPKNVDVNYNLKIISPLDEGDYGVSCGEISFKPHAQNVKIGFIL